MAEQVNRRLQLTNESPSTIRVGDLFSKKRKTETDNQVQDNAENIVRRSSRDRKKKSYEEYECDKVVVSSPGSPSQKELEDKIMKIGKSKKSKNPKKEKKEKTPKVKKEKTNDNVNSGEKKKKSH